MNIKTEKLIYEDASIEVIIFENNDIVTNSGAISLPEDEF